MFVVTNGHDVVNMQEVSVISKGEQEVASDV